MKKQSLKKILGIIIVVIILSVSIGCKEELPTSPTSTTENEQPIDNASEATRVYSSPPTSPYNDNMAYVRTYNATNENIIKIEYSENLVTWKTNPFITSENPLPAKTLTNWANFNNIFEAYFFRFTFQTSGIKTTNFKISISGGNKIGKYTTLIINAIEPNTDTWYTFNNYEPGRPNVENYNSNYSYIRILNNTSYNIVKIEYYIETHSIWQPYINPTEVNPFLPGSITAWAGIDYNIDACYYRIYFKSGETSVNYISNYKLFPIVRGQFSTLVINNTNHLTVIDGITIPSWYGVINY